MTTPPHTILVVEDDTELAELYRQWLPDEYTVRIACGGRSGLEQYDKTVDLVLLDRRMPGYSGDDVLEAIHTHEHDCPVAMLTAIEPDADIVDLPFDKYITKPVDAAELRENVQQLLDGSTENHGNEMLAVLGEETARRCLVEIGDQSATAKELADATGYSLPTVYRRLNSLKQVGLIDEQTQLDPDGHHRQAFTVVANRVCIDISDGFGIELSGSSGETE